MKNLASKGLSMSQAFSISNLCNQRAIEIENVIGSINNCSKEIDYEGKKYISQQPRPMPSDIIQLIIEKGRLHATQAFLMENINEKEKLLKDKQKEIFQSSTKVPEPVQLEIAKMLPSVKEDWGWSQLTLKEMGEFIEAESYAAHIGQFIHKGSTLDLLRRELPNLKTLEWITPSKENLKTYPVEVIPHHTSEQLIEIHESLAVIHRKYEQKVNYFKSKVKNLVAEENARISNLNADEQSLVMKINSIRLNDHNTSIKEYNDLLLKEKHQFEAERQKSIKEIAALRIDVDPIFQPLIDEFLKKLESK